MHFIQSYNYIDIILLLQQEKSVGLKLTVFYTVELH